MTVTYLGGGTLGQALPGLATANAQLQGTLVQIASLKTSVVTDINKAIGQTSALQSILTDANSALVSAQLLVTQADAVATAALALVTTIGANLGTAGVGLYSFNGDAANLGSELQAALGTQGQTGTTFALVTVASSGVAISAIQSVFKTS